MTQAEIKEELHNLVVAEAKARSLFIKRIDNISTMRESIQKQCKHPKSKIETYDVYEFKFKECGVCGKEL